MSGDHPDKSEQKRRSPRHVRAAARLLTKEARAISKKHAEKLGETLKESIDGHVATIDELSATASETGKAADWARVEDECEALDDLLHERATWARKSPTVELLINVGIALAVALGLRSCLFEPFKIPSGSMMPTLRAGDHIFVNKFRYGIQVPFTNTIVAKDVLSEIERGDIIVFRYPLDESEDFIKRVIGIPGDTVRFEGKDISIRAQGETEFVTLERVKLDEPCLDESGANEVEHCRLYKEVGLDGREYVVRYLTDVDPRSEGRRLREFTVPEGRLLVRGDNRDLSHDSLAWTDFVEAVSADALITVKDLRDLTEQRQFTLTQPREGRDNVDWNTDAALYLAEYKAPQQDLALETWRAPSLGVAAILAAAVAEQGRLIEADLGEVDIATIVNEEKDLNRVDRDAAIRVAPRIRTIRVGAGTIHRSAVWTLNGEDESVVMAFRCGVGACLNDAQLLTRAARIVEAFDADKGRPARELVEPGKTIRYNQHWRSREDVEERFLDRTWRPKGKDKDGAFVRLRAWRGTDEGGALLRDAALGTLGQTTVEASPLMDLGDDAWIAEADDRFGVVLHDDKRRFVAFLECGKERCTDRAQALALGNLVSSRLGDAARNRKEFPNLLPDAELEGWVGESETPALYEWDRVVFEGTNRGGPFSFQIEVERQPKSGLTQRLDELVSGLEGVTPVQGLGEAAYSGETNQGVAHVFTVPQSDAVISTVCGPRLCPTDEVALDLAKRAATKALDVETFVDDEAERPVPFVPRGNVKGRARRIWYPFDRFWLKVD